MKNIELKIKVKDFKKIEKSLRLEGAEYYGILDQKDTYFNCTKGRLKLREINNKNFELIFYVRPDQAINKLSDYLVMSVAKARLKETKDFLTLSMGVKVVVSKHRKLWRIKNTRIHLDKVKGLGNFLELETVLTDISKKEGLKEYRKIYEILDLKGYKKINNSYSDLLPHH
jgi:adenylate cyclase, class 2